MQPRVYIGYDSREVGAYRACVNSMRAHASVQPLIMPVSSALLGAAYARPTTVRGGVRWDDISMQPMSTEFSLARFFVPLLARKGWALFCDCDFLWRCDVNELLAQARDEYAVMVVKHAHNEGSAVKMDGQVQTYYYRKNWSSLMLLNCDAPECAALTREVLNRETKHWLHGFFWCPEESRIGALSMEYNWLANVNPPVRDAAGPKVVHYTLGTPDMPGHEGAPFADEWRRYAQR